MPTTKQSGMCKSWNASDGERNTNTADYKVNKSKICDELRCYTPNTSLVPVDQQNSAASTNTKNNFQPQHNYNRDLKSWGKAQLFILWGNVTGHKAASARQTRGKPLKHHLRVVMPAFSPLSITSLGLFLLRDCYLPNSARMICLWERYFHLRKQIAKWALFMIRRFVNDRTYDWLNYQTRLTYNYSSAIIFSSGSPEFSLEK